MRKPLKKKKKITSFGYPISVSCRHALRLGMAVTVCADMEESMDAYWFCYLAHKSIEGM